MIDGFFKLIFGFEILKSVDDLIIFFLNDMKVGILIDLFVVKLYFFKGGDIGKFVVCGMVNDLVVVGFELKYIIVFFIIEEGFFMDDLERIIMLIKKYVDLVRVEVVVGDIKVVEKGVVDGIFINIIGLGVVRDIKKMFFILKIKSN